VDSSELDRVACPGQFVGDLDRDLHQAFRALVLRALEAAATSTA